MMHDRVIPPFNRRDLGAFAGGLCLIVAVLTLAAAGLSCHGLILAAASAILTILVLASLLWRLPPDLPLRPVPATAAMHASAEPPPDMPRLRVALLPEPLGWYRLDIFLDGVRIGQLRPGTAFVTSVPTGARTLTIRTWLRSLGTRELINALPGTDSDLVLEGRGDRSRQFRVARHGMAAALAGRRIVLVEPCGSAR
jgi:hypothetical protein